jgi:hypothetical protein
MGKNSKTDNTNLRVKLELRRYFLRKYHHHTPAHVLDCCMGNGLLWKTLAREFRLASYWGVDVKPKAGRLKIDSARILAQRGWTQNIIDIDTYGSPWKHWRALLPNVTQPTTIFLTFTVGSFNRLEPQLLEALGITFNRKFPFAAVTDEFFEIAIRYGLARANDCGLKIIEAVEAPSNGNARYIGLRLSPPGDKR